MTLRKKRRLLGCCIALLAALLLIPWVALELRWWRCPKCGAFLGRMEKKNNCPQCGEKLDLR